jgi:hypothetical protein
MYYSTSLFYQLHNTQRIGIMFQTMRDVMARPRKISKDTVINVESTLEVLTPISDGETQKLFDDVKKQCQETLDVLNVNKDVEELQNNAIDAPENDFVTITPASDDNITVIEDNVSYTFKGTRGDVCINKQAGEEAIASAKASVA